VPLSSFTLFLSELSTEPWPEPVLAAVSVKFGMPTTPVVFAVIDPWLLLAWVSFGSLPADGIGGLCEEA
jgi:hypothetical protein